MKTSYSLLLVSMSLLGCSQDQDTFILNEEKKNIQMAEAPHQVTNETIIANNENWHSLDQTSPKSTLLKCLYAAKAGDKKAFLQTVYSPPEMTDLNDLNFQFAYSTTRFADIMDTVFSDGACSWFFVKTPIKDSLFPITITEVNHEKASFTLEDDGRIHFLPPSMDRLYLGRHFIKMDNKWYIDGYEKIRRKDELGITDERIAIVKKNFVREGLRIILHANAITEEMLIIGQETTPKEAYTQEYIGRAVNFAKKNLKEIESLSDDQLTQRIDVWWAIEEKEIEKRKKKKGN